MNIQMTLPITIVMLVVAFESCCGEKVRGSVDMKTSDGFAFLGKFCYQYLPSDNFTKKASPAAGYVDIELTNTDNLHSDYVLIMYDDQDNSWPKIYNEESMSCEEKIGKKYRRSHHSFKMKPYGSFAQPLSVKQHIRPRWWWLYLADANCNGSNMTTIDYELHFWQNTTSWLEKEVSANDQGLNLLYSVYLIVYVVLVGIQLYAYYVYKIQQYIHQVIKLLSSSLLFELFAVAFYFCQWIVLTQTGEQEMFFPIAACVCQAISSCIFLLLLLVLAQGWTVSRFEVMYPRALLCGVIVVALLQIALSIWGLVFIDQESTMYNFNTSPQWIYACMFALIGLMFIFICIWSYRNESHASKKNLYSMLCLLFSAWFLWPIVRIAIGNYLFKPWNRDIALLSTSITVRTITYFMMMVLMWPTHAHQYFNLTMIDTQQRILGLDDASGVVTASAAADSGAGSGKRSSDYKVLEQDRL